MRLFVPPFDHFGEAVEDQQTPEYYAKKLSKIQHLREHFGSQCFVDDDINGKLDKKKFLKECQTYHGYGGGDRGIDIRPGGKVELYYAIFQGYNYNKHNEGHKDYRTWYIGTCNLRIWLDIKDVMKILG